MESYAVSRDCPADWSQSLAPLLEQIQRLTTAVMVEVIKDATSSAKIRLWEEGFEPFTLRVVEAGRRLRMDIDPGHGPHTVVAALALAKHFGMETFNAESQPCDVRALLQSVNMGWSEEDLAVGLGLILPRRFKIKSDALALRF